MHSFIYWKNPYRNGSVPESFDKLVEIYWYEVDKHRAVINLIKII